MPPVPGDAPASGDAEASGGADEPGNGLEPTGTSGDGVPLGRTMKTGPLAEGDGELEGSGTGVGVASPVARGVGGTSVPGPFGNARGIGMSEADGLGLASGFGTGT